MSEPAERPRSTPPEEPAATAPAPSASEERAAPAPSPTARAWVVSVGIGLAVSAWVAHRSGEREALRLGGSPSEAAMPPPPAPGGSARALGGQPSALPGPSSEGRPKAAGRLAPPAGPPSASPPPESQPGGGAEPPPDAALERLAVTTFGDARAGLSACLREEREERGDLAGPLPVTVLVDARGLVADVSLGTAALRSPTFDACARLVLLELVFPEPLHARALSITYRLE